MIESKYELQARIAADALREALIAVEACRGDEELTKIVIHLADDRTRLCNLFGLNTPQVYQAPGPGRVWSPEHRAYVGREPIEIDLDRHPDGTPFTNDDYPSVAMVPYEGDEPYCCTSDEDCWCDPSGRNRDVTE